MYMTDTQVYTTMLTDYVKKQMIILGPNVALGTAKKVAGLTLTDDGSVTAVEGDPNLMLQAVKNAFMNLTGEIAQMTFQKVLDKYPEIHQTS
jgi:hypothetical protein